MAKTLDLELLASQIVLLLLIVCGQNNRSTFAQEVNIFPIGSSPVVKIPSESHRLLSTALLLCGIEPSSLAAPENYTTRWITPSGEIIDVHLTDRFVFIEADLPVDSTGTVKVPGTALWVKQLSYQDDGAIYTCEGRSTAVSEFSPWASATIELQLCLELQTNRSKVMTSTNDSSIELSCEMRAFIRPDSSLIWEGPDGQRITDGTEKYQITFSDGAPEQGVNRTIELVPSRVSTLTIYNPEPSDAGDYTCSVVGTDQVISISLVMADSESITAATPITSLVPGPEFKDDIDIEATSVTSSPSPTKSISFIPVIVGSAAGALGLLTIIFSSVALCILLKFKKSKEMLSIATSYPIYDYPTHLPENNNHYQIVSKRRTYEEGGMISDATMERNEAYGLSTRTFDGHYCDLNGNSDTRDSRIMVARNEAYGEENDTDLYAEIDNESV